MEPFASSDQPTGLRCGAIGVDLLPTRPCGETAARLTWLTQSQAL